MVHEFAMIKIDATTIFALSKNASFQALGEGAVLLMIDSGQIYTCNETTEAFLKLVDGERSFGAILDELSTEFAIDRETLTADFLAAAGDLRSEGIIEVRQDAR